jgi:hypothetical protein
MEENDDIKATEMKLLCCYGQAQWMTDERRPKTKSRGYSLEEKKVQGLARKSCTKECR